MKKLLAILGSIGLTSTTASAVIACGNGGNANVGGNKSIVVNPDIANGSYDSDSKTFTAQYGSDKYQAHKMSFSLTKVVLKAENIQVVNAQGTNVDQKSGLWNFWISKNGANTVFEIEDSSLNEATVQIDLPNHLPTVFKIAIHQDQNIVVNNVINGSYDANTTTLTAEYQSSQYNDDKKMHFSLANVSLSESNFNVIKSDGTKTEVKDGLWSFVVTDNTTTVHIDDYHLDQGTIQINLDGYNSITFKIVINQSKEIAIDNTVTNGSYSSDSKTFTADYRSSQYNDHKMSFTINDLALGASNVVVKAVDEPVTTGWSLSTTTNTTTITIDDYHLDQATIQINLDGYNSITFKIVINQSKEIAIDNTVANGSYSSDSKTFTADYRSSQYSDHKMSFTINDLALGASNVVVVKAVDEQVTTGWSLSTTTNTTTITIDDYHLDQATIEIKDVEGYWPIVFDINIKQDKNVIVNSDVSHGSYDDTTKTFTANYGSSKYDDNHLLFSLKVLISTEQKIIVKDANGQVIEQASDRWSFWTSDDGANTVIEIKDGSLNHATISIQDVEGYWPETFNITITQDKHFVIEDVTNGSYDDTTKTFTATYKSSVYQNHELSFKIKGLTLQGKDFVHVRSNSDQEITTGWNLAISGNDTIITIDDYNLNNTKVIVQNVDGYWNDTFNVIIPQDQIFSPDVTNGNYDATTKTFTANYGSSVYQNHELSFVLNEVVLNVDNIVVKNSAGQSVAQNSGWSFAISGENTTITIDDYNLNEATIEVKDVDGYWPIVFDINIKQDKNFIVNSDVSHGSYNASSQTLTAEYSGDEYNSNHMVFSIKDINLTEENIVVRDSEEKVVELSSDLWSMWTANDGVSTVFEIKNTSLNGATIEIKDVDGYWPVTLKVVID